MRHTLKMRLWKACCGARREMLLGGLETRPYENQISGTITPEETL